MDLSFQEKNNDLKILYLVAEILSKNPVLLPISAPAPVKAKHAGLILP